MERPIRRDRPLSPAIGSSYVKHEVSANYQLALNARLSRARTYVCTLARARTRRIIDSSSQARDSCHISSLGIVTVRAFALTFSLAFFFFPTGKYVSVNANRRRRRGRRIANARAGDLGSVRIRPPPDGGSTSSCRGGPESHGVPSLSGRKAKRAPARPPFFPPGVFDPLGSPLVPDVASPLRRAPSPGRATICCHPIRGYTIRSLGRGR